MAVTTKKTFAATTNATTTTFSPVSIQLNNQDDLDVYVTLSGGTRVLQLRQSTGSTAQSSHPQVNNTDGLYFPAVSAGTTLYNYTLSSDNNTITFNSALPSGAVVFCERRTRDADSSYTSFASGSTIRATDLNNSSTESNFTAQDARNKALDLEGSIFNGVQPTINGVAQPFVNSSKIIDGSIATVDIADSAITSAKIADNNVITAKIANSNVTTAKIADSNVTTAKIANDAITGAKIADDSINSEHYADGSIDTAHIADSQVTTAKIANDNVTTGKLANDSVTTLKILDANVTTAKIADSAVTTAKIADDNVTTGKLGTNSVTTLKITDANVTTPKIADGAVITAKLGNDAVTTGKIGANQVTTAKIADANITAAKIASNAVTTDKIADGELTTLAGMQSGTASKLADSTALTADIADLNQIDGLTKQTTISDSDASFPTSGAVVDYVAAQLLPFGGFEAIATEVAFPNTQPASGVAISISDAGGVVFGNGSGGTTAGQSLTGRTVGGSTVTINNAPSTLNGETLAAGVGLIVTSTGSGQIYNYHKILGKEADIKQLSDDINDFAERYRVGSSNPTTSLNGGDLFFNTGSGKLLVYNATNTAWEETQSVGNFFINTISSFSGTGGNSATFNGTAYKFNISNAGANAEQHIVSVNGVIQKPNSGTSQPSEGFAIDGGAIIFSSAPPSGADYFIITIGASVSIGTPSNNTVTTAILQNGSVTTAKIVDANVTTAKITDANVTTAKIANDAITGAKIADNAINSEHYTDGSIDTAHIADSQVTTAKIADDAITSAKINGSAVTASHLGSSAVSTAKIADDAVTQGKIADQSIDEARLQVSNSPTNGYFLSAQSGNTGGLTWAQVTTDLVGDTSPQLGGDLQTNGNNIGFGDSSDGSSDDVLKFGAGNDLTIFHNGSGSYIKDTGTGNLVIASSLLQITNAGVSENMAKFNENGSVELYYDNIKKLETMSGGIKVTSANAGTAGIIIEGPEGHDSYIQWEADDGDDNPDFYRWNNKASDNTFSLENYGDGAWEKNIVVTHGESVDLYYDNTSRIETTSYGGYINGSFHISTTQGSINGIKQVIYGGATVWQNSGTGTGANQGLYVGNGTSGTTSYVWNYEDASIDFATNNTARWRILSGGALIPNANNSYDIGTSSNRVANVYTNDLHLSNEGSSNDVDSTWGDWTIQEGESDLFLKNNRSGKKYKFNLTEVS